MIPQPTEKHLKCAEEIFRELSGRSGYDLGCLDDQIQDEIKHSWAQILAQHFPQEQKVDERLLEALHAINDYCESDIVGNGRDINNINRIAKNALNIKENQNTSEKESEKEVMQTEDARPIHGTPSAVDSRGATAEKDAQSFIEAKDCYYCCVYGPSNCAVHKPSL